MNSWSITITKYCSIASNFEFNITIYVNACSAYMGFINISKSDQRIPSVEIDLFADPLALLTMQVNEPTKLARSLLDNML